MKFDKIVIDKIETETGNTFVGRKVPLSSAEIEEQGSLVGGIVRARQEGMKAKQDKNMQEVGRALRDGFLLTGWTELAQKAAKKKAIEGREDGSSWRGERYYDLSEVVQNMVDNFDKGLHGRGADMDRAERALETSQGGYILAEAFVELDYEEVYKTFGAELLPMINVALEAATENLTRTRSILSEQKNFKGTPSNQLDIEYSEKLIEESSKTIQILNKAKFDVSANILENPITQQRLAAEVAQENDEKIHTEKARREAIRVAKLREEEEEAAAIKRSLL